MSAMNINKNEDIKNLVNDFSDNFDELVNEIL